MPDAHPYAAPVTLDGVPYSKFIPCSASSPSQQQLMGEADLLLHPALPSEVWLLLDTDPRSIPDASPVASSPSQRIGALHFCTLQAEHSSFSWGSLQAQY